MKITPKNENKIKNSLSKKGEKIFSDISKHFMFEKKIKKLSDKSINIEDNGIETSVVKLSNYIDKTKMYNKNEIMSYLDKLKPVVEKKQILKLINFIIELEKYNNYQNNKKLLELKKEYRRI